ncbi:RNA recognition motif-containing protein [Macrophomina phaseolina]|uniref:RNA recognition motif-containing protein n=1 Tax=Macrophomina phaseolina TaxID=35725 RepID=A0ABQ8GRJ6_9PEZI|nr:RNA recognition motif-containing protein [Macrophomina phaseolina]
MKLLLMRLRDWVHDRYEDDDSRRPSRNRGPRSERLARRTPDTEREPGYKLRVENLHYDLTEEDILELFERIGPVEDAKLVYDRSDRSTGVAFVVYRSLADARVACREFDGANAHGQPIHLSLLPPGPSRRNPFDSVQRPSRSLFDRIEGGRNRSLSPERPRLSDVSKPAPAGIDRYVPGDDDGRRPRKTVEELDAEMADYFGGGGEGGAGNGQAAHGSEAAAPAASNAGTVADDDIDMVE